MHVLHINPTDLSGGAGRAAYRIHCGFREYGVLHDLHSQMRVITKESDATDVIGGPAHGKQRMLMRLRRRRQVKAAWRGFVQPSSIHHSIAFPDSGLGQELKRWQVVDPEHIVHLHWVGEAPHRGDVLISIEEIGHLTGPCVWTLHDQWAFSGAEHYSESHAASADPSFHGHSHERFVHGYSPESRSSGESFRDLNRDTWLRKQRSWRQPIQIVCPSRWMADCARRSALMAHWPIAVIPNPIDPDQWAPVASRLARRLLGLPADRPLVLFGSIGGTSDPRKGGDLLLAAMQELRIQLAGTALDNVELVIFGQGQPSTDQKLGFPVHYLGRLHDDLSLRLAYSAADVFVIPSRQDNLPNTGLEAHACATPVVAFRTGGLVDIVDPGTTGCLAEPFDPVSLAASIQWVIEDPARLRKLRASARSRALDCWHPKRITSLYAEVYQSAIHDRHALQPSLTN